MKISDCRAVSPFKTLPGCRAFRHSEKKYWYSGTPISYPPYSTIHAIPYFLIGIICGPKWGSFPVRDHLRSNLGIICGPGSFAVLGSFADPYRTVYRWRSGVAFSLVYDSVSRLFRYGQTLLTRRTRREMESEWFEYVTVIPSSRSLIFEVKSTGSELAFIRVSKTSEDFGRLRKTSDFLE